MVNFPIASIWTLVLNLNRCYFRYPNNHEFVHFLHGDGEQHRWQRNGHCDHSG